MREQGRDIIALSVGEPDFPTPAHIKTAAREALARNDTKYTAVDGTRALKEAVVAKFWRDNQLEYAPEQVLISSGAKQSCYNACLALLDPGDEAIIPAPYWVSYPDMVRLADAEPVIVHSTARERFQDRSGSARGRDYAADAAVDPEQPVQSDGRGVQAEDWVAFGDVLREHPRIVILADDIYEHIYWAGRPFTSFAAACPQLYARTLTVNGMSKAYAMSGWRVGYAAGPLPVIKAMTSLQSQSTTSACTVSQAAARVALASSQTTVRQMCTEFRRRHQRCSACERYPGFPLRAGARRVLPFSERGRGDEFEACRERCRALRAAARGDRRCARTRLRVRRAGAPALIVRRVARQAPGRVAAHLTSALPCFTELE